MYWKTGDCQYSVKYMFTERQNFPSINFRTIYCLKLKLNLRESDSNEIFQVPTTGCILFINVVFNIKIISFSARPMLVRNNGYISDLYGAKGNDQTFYKICPQLVFLRIPFPSIDDNSSNSCIHHLRQLKRGIIK